MRTTGWDRSRRTVCASRLQAGLPAIQQQRNEGAERQDHRQHLLPRLLYTFGTLEP
jgi:hypothetical protein